jgi:2-polyprenyl-3-methyl-5-hydroxy-6-metoxy-1,4-benzoquinol methylase
VKTYIIPDIEEWPEDDPRRQIQDFDEEFLRNQYNDLMSSEQPALPEASIGFNQLEHFFSDSIGQRGGKCLDIGCGNGRLMVTLLKFFDFVGVYGIDVSDVMVANALETASNNGVDIIVERAAIETYVPLCAFDSIIATETLEHIYRLTDALTIIATWLVDDGLLAGTVPLRKTCDAIVHLHYFTATSLEHLLKNYFQEVNIKSVGITGTKEVHLAFLCQYPKRYGMDE